MTEPDTSEGFQRRTLLAATAGWLLAPGGGLAQGAQSAAAAERSVLDGSGRRVPVPARVQRVFPAGPPAAILLYTLAPDLLLGWPRANRPEELEFLLPEVGRRPEVGRITGRGNSANLESVLALQPDLIVDSGAINDTYIDLANRVQAQTSIPYALLDGRFAAIPESYRLLGELLGRPARALELGQAASAMMQTVKSRVDAIPAARRPRVYYARGPMGLETGLGGSINIESLGFMGLRLVSADTPGSGLARVSIEQVLAWDPDVILTIDREFAARVHEMPMWQAVRAVRERRVHLSPRLPFGWIDFPPGVNRLPGLWWLGKMVFPEAFPEPLAAIARDFYRQFYGVQLDNAQIDRVLAGRGT
jgi:iron complex transport system substrate-binding protein